MCVYMYASIYTRAVVRFRLLLLSFSPSVMSNSLWSHGSQLAVQEARLPCPSPSPRACSNSCPLSQWCHPTISSSVILFSFCLQSFPASMFFQWVGSLHQVARVLELQLQHQSFQWIFRIDFLQDWLVWSPCSPKDWLESPPAQFESINSVLSLLYGTTLISVHDYWKDHSFDYMDLCQQSDFFAF